jgi:hypothetical protein
MKSGDEKRTGWKPRIRHELVEYFTNFVFLSLIFGAFTLYRRLILTEYHIGYAHYGIGLIEALVLAKIVMIGNIFGLGRRLEDRPLIFPTLYKAFTFSLWVAVFGAFEHIVEGFLRGEGLTGGLHALMSQGKYELLAKALIMFFAFMPFFAFREMERVLGEGAIGTLFFRSRVSAESGRPGTQAPHRQADEKRREKISVRK